MNPTVTDKFARFEPIVREHQAGLRAYIRALGVQDAWVDDLAQEAFLIAYRRFEHFDASADFGRWLRGIARQLVRNELRKVARRSRLLLDPIAQVLVENEAEDVVGPETTPGLLRALADCVARLPSRSRELLKRRYAGDCDATALARAFQASPAAVRQTLLRTRAAVRRCIGAKLGEAWS